MRAMGHGGVERIGAEIARKRAPTSGAKWVGGNALPRNEAGRIVHDWAQSENVAVSWLLYSSRMGLLRELLGSSAST